MIMYFVFLSVGFCAGLVLGGLMSAAREHDYHTDTVTMQLGFIESDNYDTDTASLHAEPDEHDKRAKQEVKNSGYYSS